MPSSEYENDELIFLDEEPESIKAPEVKGTWNVLVVDDDKEIHSVTRLALSDLELNKRQLTFHHAYSGKEALDILAEKGREIAVILLDVVMETDSAGLHVAQVMREELELDEPRIILRTGQPGYAPEESVIKEYDINDYKTKTELTRGRLATAMIAALRSYQQIRTINLNRQGLHKIIESASNLLEEHSIKGFCEGVVIQICSFLGLEADGVVCAKANSLVEIEGESVIVLGAAGEYAPFINQQIENLSDDNIVYNVSECLRRKEHIYTEDFTVLYIERAGYEAAAFLKCEGQIPDTHKTLLEVFVSSISVGYENVNLFHQLRTAAFQDWLTHLANRNEFINILDEVKRSDKQGAGQVVALVDINHFSDFNDGLGHDAGNMLLVSIAERLEEDFPENVRLARIGADVFGLVGPESLINPDTISDIFATPFIAGDHSLPVNANVGFCRLLADKCNGITLLKQTNIALNRAKKEITSWYDYYEPDMEEKTTWRLGMIRQLRVDFGERILQVWFQPQVDLVSEKVVGLEALLRWPSKDGGFISPAIFVPFAEYSGLIIDIGDWVLDESCRHLKMLHNNGFAHLRVAVNISIPQFRNPGFVASVKNAIERHGIKPHFLELEITESVVMDEPQIVVDALKELKQYGVTIAIDDFGTGFSSMNYLHKLPLDRLKVDRSFVEEVLVSKTAFIAETIVTLGNKLGLKTIAEGVEEREQASHMLKLGCDEAQGYLFAKPMPYDDLVTFLEAEKKA
ncbi:EAL domain-containing protein [Aestuariibacter sp. AA17]|uniref:EAL domain-containing protein n=1 Tax=Fluctibacter corallii TaxID=2984329 RepID=A0ABT3ADC0_9ALTE|nr:EAL domain-containing protein [Aestuariibacter sp. AA17]MCV2886633.1 EAL domain-containing protein [Aestuariibacter sp. AA17]